MSTIVTREPSADVIEQVLIGGDLSKLNVAQRTEYYGNVCKSLGLNPLTKPFDYITLNGKMVLYAKRDATDQLRSIKNVSVQISTRERIEDVWIVTAKARMPDGREDESIGAVNVAGLKGDNMANALMKAETKAKRRVTLSICGLGLLDESEIETIPAAARDISPPSSAAPTTTEATDIGEYKPIFGKFKGQAIKTIGFTDLAQYSAWIEQSIANSGQPGKPGAIEFLKAANEYLDSIEPSDAEAFGAESE